MTTKLLGMKQLTLMCLFKMTFGSLFLIKHNVLKISVNFIQHSQIVPISNIFRGDVSKNRNSVSSSGNQIGQFAVSCYIFHCYCCWIDRTLEYLRKVFSIDFHQCFHNENFLELTIIQQAAPLQWWCFQQKLVFLVVAYFKKHHCYLKEMPELSKKSSALDSHLQLIDRLDHINVDC
jgi:hypothetical protein